jgi:hypothetical protein
MSFMSKRLCLAYEYLGLQKWNFCHIKTNIIKLLVDTNKKK